MQQEEFDRKNAYQARLDAKAALAEAKNSKYDGTYVHMYVHIREKTCMLS
jgi:hypothetical protein